ncbi:MAG: HDIG domain-containing protein [Bacteroidales bacterium]|uniref:HD family phosphohydrolase n=1 Tax=Sodaliphilus sp. TaxID=2815818 RepID=UPI001B55C9AF|nr:HDIG domain-containing protein [Candidatus Sodaliphilus limicaballi]
MTNKRHNYLIILMFVVATTLISLALPRQDGIASWQCEVGKPWPYDMLIAPFDFPVEPDENEKTRKSDSIEASFIKFYRLEESIASQQISALSKDMGARKDIPAATKMRILHDVTKAYKQGIVDNATGEAINNGTLTKMRILDDKSVASIVKTDSMRSVRQVYTFIDSTYRKGTANMDLAFISNYLEPNVELDKTTTDTYLNDALKPVTDPIMYIQTGEAIIFKGNIVTPRQYNIIKTLESQIIKKDQESTQDDIMIIVGKILIVTIIMLIYCVFLISMRYRVYNNMRSMVFLISFMTLFIISVFFVVKFRPNYMSLVPFALVPIMISVFFDTRISFFTHIVVIVVCSLVASEQAQFIAMQFLAGCIAIASMQELTRRSQLVICAMLIFVVYCAMHIAFQLTRGDIFLSLSDIDWHQFMYYATNCVMLSFAYVAIFVVEKLFGFTSLVTLVELSDINTPLLRRMSERCPGTFQHVLQVANLASEAALKVGASQQLVRAGALYHDVGKISNPAFFTENQTGVNPHMSLDPDQSASIVIDHVKDGLAMADKARLPQVIKDLIAQHHGTSLTRYFYNMACNNNGGQAVDTEPYTYPGPKPQTKEAAILMMADACEAAARSLNDYSEESITALVEKIIDSQIADGQLKEAPISFSQVEIIKKVFIERLRILHHRRISYPERIKPKQDNA